MTTIADIHAQIAELTAKAEQIRREKYREVLAEVQAKITTYEIIAGDLVFPDASGKTPKTKTVNKAPVKYRDKDGNTWTGRGLKPKWLKQAIQNGATLESFAVDVPVVETVQERVQEAA